MSKLITWADLAEGGALVPPSGKRVEAQDIANWLGSKQPPTQEMQDIAEAVTYYVNRLPSIDLEDGGDWAQTTKTGAVMLGARLYKRRNSPNGIESFSEVGNTYVSRYDSDIARLLNIEAFRKPMVG